MRSKVFRDLVEKVIHAIDGELHDTDYQYGSTSLRAMIARIARSECKDYLDERITEQAKTIEKQKQVISALHNVHHLDWDGSPRVRDISAWDGSADSQVTRFTD